VLVDTIDLVFLNQPFIYNETYNGMALGGLSSSLCTQVMENTEQTTLIVCEYNSLNMGKHYFLKESERQAIGEG